MNFEHHYCPYCPFGFYPYCQQTLPPMTLIYPPYQQFSTLQSPPQEPILKQEDSEIESKIQVTVQDLRKYPQETFKSVWSEEEDKKLLQLVEKQKLDWNDVSKKMENRSYKMCYSRYKRIKAQKKETWTSQEDKRVKQLVEEYGMNWKMISLNLSNRSSKQVRERYINFLRPNLSSKRWTIDEDIKLLGLIKEHGKKWINIEKQMKSRSHYQIKNRFFNRIMGVWKKKMLSKKVA